MPIRERDLQAYAVAAGCTLEQAWDDFADAYDWDGPNPYAPPFGNSPFAALRLAVLQAEGPPITEQT